jgi:hypothetical protein
MMGILPGLYLENGQSQLFHLSNIEEGLNLTMQNCIYVKNPNAVEPDNKDEDEDFDDEDEENKENIGLKKFKISKMSTLVCGLKDIVNEKLKEVSHHIHKN